MTQIRKVYLIGFAVIMLLISTFALADEPALTGVPISAADDSPGNLFGGSVSVSGDYALVGASRNNAAYIFVRDGVTWSQQAKLTVQGEAADFGWPEGDLTAVTDAEAATTRFDHDGLGRVIRMTKPMGVVYEYTYDPPTAISRLWEVPSDSP